MSAQIRNGGNNSTLSRGAPDLANGQPADAAARIFVLLAAYLLSQAVAQFTGCGTQSRCSQQERPIRAGFWWEHAGQLLSQMAF